MKLYAVTDRIRLPAIRMPQLWILAVLVAIFTTCVTSTIAIADYWWHLKVGETIFSTHSIPAVDTFSFVARDRPFVYEQWLAELGLYLIYHLGGLPLVILGNALVITGTGALVVWSAYETSGKLSLAAVCAALGLLVGLNNRDVRPQVLAFFFFALVFLLLLRYRRGHTAPLWLIPIVAALWANVHGTVILGFGLCVVVLAGEVVKTLLGSPSGEALSRRRLGRLAVVTGAVIPAMMVNPWGPGIFRYVFGIQSNPAIQTYVTEWFAPSFRNSEDVPFFLVLLACVAFFALSPKSLDITDVLLFVVFAALALQAVRNSIWFGIVAAPLAAQQIGAIADHWRARIISRKALAKPNISNDAFANYSFALFFIALAFLALPWVKTNLPLAPRWRGFIDPDTPVAAVRYAAAQYPAARFFHPATFGSYMIWAAPDGPPVFIDGRIELYPMEVIRDYMAISQAEDWDVLLAKYRVDHLLLSKHPYKGFQQALLSAVAASSNWERTYEDGEAVIYMRR